MKRPMIRVPPAWAPRVRLLGMALTYTALVFLLGLATGGIGGLLWWGWHGAPLP